MARQHLQLLRRLPPRRAVEKSATAAAGWLKETDWERGFSLRDWKRARGAGGVSPPLRPQ